MSSPLAFVPALRRTAFPLGLLFGLPLFVAAQSTPAPASNASGAASSSGSGDETVMLKEFNVNDSADNGYITANAIGVTRSNEALIDTPQAISVINQNFMQDYNPGELADVLKYVPSVTIESNVGDSAMIRGFTVRDQFTDGMVDNQNQSQAGAEPFQYERIEVIKGPEGLVYGSTAIGGVTNRVRKKPNFKPRTEIAFTVGNHNQTKTELDANIPASKKFAFRLIATYRNENLVNGVQTRFAYFNRWNVNPSMMWRINSKSQLYIYGEFLAERGYKHWGEVGMFLPPSAVIPGRLTAAAAAAYPRLGSVVPVKGSTDYFNGGFTTWGILPRDFTFGDPQSHSINKKRATGMFYEAKPFDGFLLRAGGTLSWWNHFVEDVIPVNMAADNRHMTRTWRTISNIDFYTTEAIDSSYAFKLLGTEQKLFSVAQFAHRGQYQEIWAMNGARPIPALDIYNPDYTPYNAFDRVHNNLQWTDGNNFSWGAKDSVKMFNGKFLVAGGPRYDWFSSRTDNNLTGVTGKTNVGHTWTYNYGAVLKPFSKNYSLFYGHSETYNPNFGAQPDGTPFPSQVGLVNEVGLKMAFFDNRIAGTISTYKLEQNHILLSDPDPIRAAAGWRIDSGQNTTRGQEVDLFFQVTRDFLVSVGGGAMKYTTTTGIDPRGAPSHTANATVRYKFSEGVLKGFGIGGGYTHKSKFQAETPAATDRVARFYLPGNDVFDMWMNYRWKNYTFQLNINNVANTWYLQRSVSKDQILQGPERLIKIRVSRVF